MILFGFLPLIAIVTLNLLSIRRLNKRLKRFSLRVVKPPVVRENNTDSHISSENAVAVSKIEFHFGIERRKRSNVKLDAYTKRNRKAISCILALTVSIIFTQSIYLITWPLFNQSSHDKTVKAFYITGVWLSYLTSLFNPILLCLFNSKVKAQSREILNSLLEKLFTFVRLFY